jgi:hypothetical protein
VGIEQDGMLSGGIGKIHGGSGAEQIKSRVYDKERTVSKAYHPTVGRTRYGVETKEDFGRVDTRLLGMLVEGASRQNKGTKRRRRRRRR